MNAPVSLTETLLRVAVPSPLPQYFDYLPPLNLTHPIVAGVRVKIPFGKRELIGMVIEVVTHTTIDPKHLRPALALLDKAPVLPARLCQLLTWASQYYHYPIGQIYHHALPKRLRQGKAAVCADAKGWQLTSKGLKIDITTLRRAPKQQALLRYLQEAKAPIAEVTLKTQFLRSTLKILHEKDWITPCEISSMPTKPAQFIPPTFALNQAQYQALTHINQAANQFSVFLLHGITGSGKTEVYIQAIWHCLKQGKQALVLVPEISLTPQTVSRFQARFNHPIAVMHSARNDSERLDAWVMAQKGYANIVIGTRSAIFTPLKNLGLIILDEEHDASFKQQTGFRYSARDLAIMRAHIEHCPIILGSATPSLESFYNAKLKRYQLLNLNQRVGNANLPAMRCLDIRDEHLDNGLSTPLIQAIEQHLVAKQQVLIFLNRRGYAPILICHHCGWVAFCPRCDAKLTLHFKDNRLRCHHCSWESPMYQRCAHCHSTTLHSLGQGTERVEEALTHHFADYPITRFDRDNMSTKAAFEQAIAQILQGQPQILIGTQMLAKGHHFPKVTLVVILDADSGLFSIDFRASERIGQLLLQVAGRAGRAEAPGEVIIQTRHPEHPQLLSLMHQSYHEFATQLLDERKAALLPPYTYLALLRAAAPTSTAPFEFLNAIKTRVLELNKAGISVLGPITAPMARKAGQYHAQLLIQASKRHVRQALLDVIMPELNTWPLARKVRWSLDVDPFDLY